jgi:aspartyl-tRNA(Asn)/glutamyl-tRNA(Gln) amidotransferase subunit B
MPLCHDGHLVIETESGQKTIGIKRVHLEEDAGKLIHEAGAKASLVDYNRTGIPLLEIVSQPDIASPQEAYDYLTNLKAILQYLGISDCTMEEGSLRCDANISIRPAGSTALGVKVEVKNMNTFKGVRAALAYEEQRQRVVVEDKGTLIQETRLWDAERELTNPMRSKEEAHDYRYFPEPDLVPFEIKQERIERCKATLPELPNARRERFQKEYQLTPYDASILVSDKDTADYFEECLNLLNKPKAIANWITQDIAAALNARGIGIRQLNVSPDRLVGMVSMIESGTISGKNAKEILALMMDTGKDASTIVKEKGLSQVSSETEIRELVKAIIEENQKSVNDYRSGKEQAITHLVGQAMKKTRGRANPQLLHKILKEELTRG